MEDEGAGAIDWHDEAKQALAAIRAQLAFINMTASGQVDAGIEQLEEYLKKRANEGGNE